MVTGFWPLKTEPVTQDNNTILTSKRGCQTSDALHLTKKCSNSNDITSAKFFASDTIKNAFYAHLNSTHKHRKCDVIIMFTIFPVDHLGCVLSEIFL